MILCDIAETYGKVRFAFATSAQTRQLNETAGSVSSLLVPRPKSNGIPTAVSDHPCPRILYNPKVVTNIGASGPPEPLWANACVLTFCHSKIQVQPHRNLLRFDKPSEHSDAICVSQEGGEGTKFCSNERAIIPTCEAWQWRGRDSMFERERVKGGLRDPPSRINQGLAGRSRESRGCLGYGDNKDCSKKFLNVFSYPCIYLGVRLKAGYLARDPGSVILYISFGQCAIESLLVDHSLEQGKGADCLRSRAPFPHQTST